MRWAVVVVVCSVATIARAQSLPPYEPAPSQPTQPPPSQPPSQPPSTQTPPYEPTPSRPPSQTPPYEPTQQTATPPAGATEPPPRPSVMTRRFSVSLALGVENLRAAGGNRLGAQLGFFDLSGRFRIKRFLDLGLTLHGGGSEYMGIELSTVGLYIDARWRFLPENKWNLYVVGSLGVRSATAGDASEIERRGRGSLRLGGGVELRFTWLGLFAELMLQGVGENPDVPAVTPPTIGYELARYRLSGVALALGATLYF